MATRILKLTNGSCVVFLLSGANRDPHTLQVPMTGTGHLGIKLWRKPAANICPSSFWREASVCPQPLCCTFLGRRILICSSRLAWCHPDSTLSGSGFKAHRRSPSRHPARRLGLLLSRAGWPFFGLAQPLTR